MDRNELYRRLTMPKYCPICGDPLEDGLCLSCGYDAHLDGDLSFDSEKSSKKSGSLIDDLLNITSSDDDDPLL